MIAVAYRNVDEQAAYRVGDEKDLTLAGSITFSDPPLPDAKEIIENMKADGVQVKIITGDNEP